jgi:hypothetical protein
VKKRRRRGGEEEGRRRREVTNQHMGKGWRNFYYLTSDHSLNSK